MTKEDLKSFKIQGQAGVKQPTKKEAPPAPPPSVGFPHIEAVVESPDLAGFESRLAQLQELANSGSNNDKLAEKKAAAAYEKARALLQYLLDTKARLAAPAK